MDTPVGPKIELKNIGPEVKSFIYQAIVEFEPFTTPDTVVSVVAKDPLQLIHSASSEESAIDIVESELPRPEKLKKMYRIAITLSEGDTHITEEALHKNIFEAIRLAKEKIIKTMSDIQDEVISNQDRQIQIQHALASGQVH
ncbi:MAG: hypothetical protein BroJett040_13460 [Oligoflexia bacterium]|nr:MAG: hypothetical protein BroJett040_13460 [Oligoflexia bacterium]